MFYYLSLVPHTFSQVIFLVNSEISRLFASLPCQVHGIVEQILRSLNSCCVLSAVFPLSSMRFFLSTCMVDNIFRLVHEALTSPEFLLHRSQTNNNRGMGRGAPGLTNIFRLVHEAPTFPAFLLLHRTQTKNSSREMGRGTPRGSLRLPSRRRRRRLRHQ